MARVERTALRLAAAEGADAQVVQLSALLHDVDDWKYCGDDEAAYPTIRAILSSAGWEAGLAERVCTVVRGVSFHGELGGKVETDLVTACVQDADRLDAIGAVGIARCFTYGGAKNRVLYDPAVPPAVGLSKQEYMASGRTQTTLNHFHEKLLLLRGMMKTASGRAMAEHRHAVTAAFVDEFYAEWSGEQ